MLLGSMRALPRAETRPSPLPSRAARMIMGDGGGTGPSALIPLEDCNGVEQAVAVLRSSRSTDRPRGPWVIWDCTPGNVPDCDGDLKRSTCATGEAARELGIASGGPRPPRALPGRGDANVVGRPRAERNGSVGGGPFGSTPSFLMAWGGQLPSAQPQAFVGAVFSSALPECKGGRLPVRLMSPGRGLEPSTGVWLCSTGAIGDRRKTAGEVSRALKRASVGAGESMRA
mmetsp:Transcript_34345/g.75092  ORF Transcript_34345/g.75092 Transcript_34345/m.75092 type:complete len:229 (+) Transcript_34345:926-1612(+)